MFIAALLAASLKVLVGEKQLAETTPNLSPIP
jgi:hypothetical protein